MANTIWKFPIIVNDDIVIRMPVGAELLYVATQNDTPYLWARVNPMMSNETRRLKLRGTGHNVGTDCGKYIGSFMLHSGTAVFHLFERN